MVSRMLAFLLVVGFVGLSSCRDHMMRQRLDLASFREADPQTSNTGASSSHGGVPWQHKTSFQVSNGQQWTGGAKSDHFKATLSHDVVGTKNWGAGGYVTHERFNGFKDGMTHGGVKAHINF